MADLEVIMKARRNGFVKNAILGHDKNGSLSQEIFLIIRWILQ